MSKILLGPGVRMDLDKLIESRLLVQANSGGGKSWAIRRIVEQSFGEKQIIIIDPEGEFGNLRTKFDFVYCGKGGDAPVESRSAALLAHRLLELKASAIIDLYELPPQERKHFVRLFCEAMVNAPKELWHDVIIIIDEAHIFAPEKGESEAMGAVIDLATRGRKRGYCAVLATQRLPKLNKDAAAECNNKLIGRASQDIDRKRAAEELGFSTKEDVLSLRDLDPGEFYAFGPAITRNVTRVTIADVTVKPPKRGVSRGTVPAPSATVKKMLAKLGDLPQEAQKEARTNSELRQELAKARGEITRLSKQSVPSQPPAMGVSQWREYGKERAYWDYFENQVQEPLQKEIIKLRSILEKIAKISGDFFITIDQAPIEVKIHPRAVSMPGRDEHSHPPLRFPRETVLKKVAPDVTREINKGELMVDSPEGVRPAGDINKGERVILNAIANDSEGITTEHIAVLTGYKGTSRREYLRKLTARGLIERKGDFFVATEEGIAALGSDFEPLPTGLALAQFLLQTLGGGEKLILQILLDHPQGISKEEIQEISNYKATSVREYIRKLAARKLVTTVGGLALVSNKLF